MPQALSDKELTPSPMSPAENDALTAYNQLVDFNPSFKLYVTLFGFRTGYRRTEDLAAFAGRILAKRATFELEAMALSLTFIRHHSIN